MDPTPDAPRPADQNTPVENTPLEKTPVESAPAESAPVESAAVENAPVADKPVEDKSAGEAAAQETAAETATPAEEKPAEDNPVEGGPVEDGVSQEMTPEATETGEKKKKKKKKKKNKDKDKKGKDKKRKGDKKDKSQKKKKKKWNRKKARRRPPPKHVEPPLPPELKQEAAKAALDRVVAMSNAGRANIERAIAAMKEGISIPFLARFRRSETGGMDERRLRNLRDGLDQITQLEERRTGIRVLLKKRGALTDESAAALEGAETIAAMEDIAAPFLPVTASRATVARGHGLQGLADGIRTATDTQPLSELAKTFVPEGSEPTAFDVALGGARDILAEELSLDARLRARLRALFLKEGMLKVSARTEKRREGPKQPAADVPDDAPESEVKAAAKPKGGKARAPKGSLIGFEARASKVPPMKILAIRRAEKMRQAVAAIEPPEEKAIAIVHKHAVPDDHPHAGLLRAAAEDGYRRILKPMLQNEIRLTLKRRADDFAMEQFERSLRNLLLGPYAGARRTLGLRPDVMNGHRWCVVDELGNAAGSGTLPHEPTAGREACLTELTDILKTYDVHAIAVGTSGGRADALALARQADKDIEREIDVTEVPDGGTRALESMGPMEFENHLTVGSECRGALSLARRFQDPLRELILVDPKALALGPHLHEVHQGHLRTLLDDVVESCVAHTGVDANTAGVELLTRLPGFNRQTAQAYLTYRDGAGPLKAKAELAAIDGVGPKVAEQAVGFLRIAGAEDPRDRTQLHPEQYAAAEKLAEQVGVDLETFFTSEEARKKVKLDAVADEETPLATLKHALYEAAAGQQDPRPRFTQFIPPPASIKLQDLASQPNLMLQGRVIRAAPFGLFLDVGMGVEALIPIPHIGDRPGLEPSTVAPVGAVISARVLEVEPQKKRLTLSMRRPGPAHGGRGPQARGAGGRPQRGGDRGPRGGADRGPRTQSDRPAGGRPAGDRRPAGAGAAGGPRRGAGSSFGGGRSSAGAGGGRSSGGGRSDGRTGGSTGGSTGGRPRKPGRFDGGGSRGGRMDRNTPRSISLKPEDAEKGKPKVDESKMSPEELMAYKLEQMKRKLQRPDS